MKQGFQRRNYTPQKLKMLSTNNWTKPIYQSQWKIGGWNKYLVQCQRNIRGNSTSTNRSYRY